MKKIFQFAIKKNKTDLEKISDEQKYISQFEGKSIEQNTKLYKAYEKAWDARKFEIDNYWKRTTYFWAFQITSFAAYFAIINSDSYNNPNPKNTEILFCAIAFGYITSLAWTLINIGSKFWQRHWEKHLDMLEDKITGPLYKTVFAYKDSTTFSVSKINEIVSRFFVIIWLILGIKYSLDNLTINEEYDIAWIEILILLGVLYFTCAMFFGYGRGRFTSSDFEFYRRKVFKEK